MKCKSVMILDFILIFGRLSVILITTNSVLYRKSERIIRFKSILIDKWQYKRSVVKALTLDSAPYEG